MIATSRIAGVCERDIDLLLLEEFQATPSFVEWFLMSAGIDGVSADQLVGAQRSITHSTGESDLELHFAGADAGDIILIENKVGAGLQPMQAERYRLRGQAYVAGNRCARFHTVIVAPNRYFPDPAQTKGFRHRLSYEDVISWFERADFLENRRHYKLLLLRSAIERATLGYQPSVDKAVTDFFAFYWDVAVAAFPELGMVRTRKERPGGSGRVYFKTALLAAIKCDIAHKTGKGFVDLHLRQRGGRLALVEGKLRSVLEPQMSVERAGKSAAVRVHVPVLDRCKPADEQRDGILSGLLAARALARWAEAHSRLLSTL